MSIMHESFEKLRPRNRKFLRAFALLPIGSYSLVNIISWFKISKWRKSAFQRNLMLLDKLGWISFQDDQIKMGLSEQAYLCSMEKESIEDADKLIGSLAWLLRPDHNRQFDRNIIELYLPISEHIVSKVKGKSKNSVLLLNNIGVANRVIGNYKLCKLYQGSAVKNAEEIHRFPERELVDIYIGYGDFLSRYDDMHEAVTNINKGLALYNKNPFNYPVESKSVIFHNSAVVYYNAGLNREALEYQDKVIAILLHISDKNKKVHPALAVAYDLKAQILYNLGRIEESFAYSDITIKVGKECLGPHHPGFGKLLHNYACKLSGFPDMDKLKESLNKSIHLREEAIRIIEKGSDFPELGSIYLNQGINYITMNKCDEAAAFLLKARPYIEKYTKEGAEERGEMMKLERRIEEQRKKAEGYRMRNEEEPDWEIAFRESINKKML